MSLRFGDLRRDFLYACRTLRCSPAFTIVTVLAFSGSCPTA